MSEIVLVTKSQVTNHTNFQTMPRNEIPVDVLRDIMDYVDKADLTILCRLNKICCSCSQDVLYRDISVKNLRASKVQQTLAQSAHLARRVHSFDSGYEDPDLAMALRNMTSLRILKLSFDMYMDILDGCTFKLDSFECRYVYDHDESFKRFLSSQPSLKYVTLPVYEGRTASTCPHNYSMLSLEATCLPNLTRICARLPWIPCLIPGRPLNEVIVDGYTLYDLSIDLSFFALSTTPIQKLTIDHSFLNPTPVNLLASFLPSLTHFTLKFWKRHTFTQNEGVCGLPLY